MGGGRENRRAATAKDSPSVTANKSRKKKIALPDFPYFGMHPIYPV